MIHSQEGNNNVSIKNERGLISYSAGILKLGTIDFCGQIICCGKEPPCVLQGVQQYPWPQPSRCQQHSSSIMTITKCLQVCQIWPCTKLPLVQNHGCNRLAEQLSWTAQLKNIFIAPILTYQRVTIASLPLEDKYNG